MPYRNSFGVSPPASGGGFSQTTLRGWDGASHFGVQMERTVAGNLLMYHGKGALFCHGRYEGIEVLGLGYP